jgi:glycosyltransferase involved in cell wall biosynthesis
MGDVPIGQNVILNSRHHSTPVKHRRGYQHGYGCVSLCAAQRISPDANMRIGIDITSAVRQGAGIGRFTRELIRALLTLDSPHEYRLFAATGGLPRSITEPRLAYVTQPAFARNRQRPKERGELFAICNLQFLSDDWLHRIWHRARLPIPIEAAMGRVDLFHEPDFVLPPTLPRTPTVLTVHDLTFIRDPESAFPRLRRYLNRVVPRSVARATHVLADSAATRDDLIELFHTLPDKITVLYGGVDARFAPVRDPERWAAVRAKYNIGLGPFILGIGTIQPRKNYKRLIKAFAQLQSPTPNLQLVIVGGKGWLYDDIFAEVKRLGLENRVRFPGFADDDDLPTIYSAAAVLAYPSTYEGFGLPILEAMACGTPVVTSTTSSMPELAGDAALLVEPTNVDALAAALLRAQDTALRQTLVAHGLEQTRKFRWDQAAVQLLEIYERIGAK